jgi:hypothetical protein
MTIAIDIDSDIGMIHRSQSFAISRMDLEGFAIEEAKEIDFLA